MFLAMEKLSARYKEKCKKNTPNAKQKTAKKRKSDGPTCSMFLAELSRKLANKKKQEEEPKNIVQTIIDSITNALPIKLSRRSPQKSPSPMKIETLQIYAPELIPNDEISVPSPIILIHSDSQNDAIQKEEIEIKPKRADAFKMPKMPLVNSDLLKVAARSKKDSMQDQAVNTNPNHEIATEIVKHVNTLRKISLIAEEFNQKTAKNLKEILDSVQEDLIKKLEELQYERSSLSNTIKTVEVIREESKK